MAGRRVIIGRGRVHLTERGPSYWHVAGTHGGRTRGCGRRQASRVRIAGGSPLMRQALAALLRQVGVAPVEVGAADVLLFAGGGRADLAELVACPLPVLVLAADPDAAFAIELLEERPEGTGYLIASALPDARALLSALRTIAGDGALLDAGIADELMGRSERDWMAELTPREREILALMAEGRSNQAICDHLVLSPKTVETHAGRIFSKLGLASDTSGNRRVLAVLRYVREAQPLAAAA